MPFPPWSSTGWALVAFLALAGCPGARAAETIISPNSTHSIRIWQTEDGLAQNTVTSITQTPDGYIWIGTYGGLSRFDGERFQNYDAVNTPGLEDSSVVSLHQDPRGDLWIGHDSGHITHYHNGHFEPWRISSAHAHQKVSKIGSDRSGVIWVLRQDGSLESVKDGRVLEVKHELPVNFLGLAQNQKTGAMWTSDNGSVAELVDGKLVPVDFGEARHSNFVEAMGSAADGGLWVIRDGRVRKWFDGHWTEDRGPYQWGESPIFILIELHDGTLAVGTMDKGLYLLYPGGRVLHFDRSNGLPQNWVRCLYQDREDDLWVGAGTGGLVAIRPTAFSVLNAPDQWQGRTVLSVTSDRQGALWIGTEGAGLYRYQNGGWMRYETPQGLQSLFVWAVAEAPDGKIWAGTWGGGIFRMEDDQFHHVDSIDLGSSPVLALQFSPFDNSLRAGTGRGLVQLQNEQVRWDYHPPIGSRPNVCTVLHDRDGSIWFSIAEGGLAHLVDGKLTQLRKTDGLSSDSVQCLLRDDDVLWIGTADGGLNRLKNGRLSTIGVNQGLASNVICHISDDGLGYLWLSTHRGILRLAKTELNRCADGLSPSVAGQIYDRNDGLPTLEYSGGLQAAGCKTADGRLWFPSSKGLVSVDPASIRLNPTPPPLALEILRVDGRVVDARTEIRLPPDHERLEFQYTALSLAAPSKVLFKYRLQGLDKDWVDAGTKRTAFYSHLPAGSYRFELIACNNDGFWNREGVALAFTVLPFFWQTWWFISLAAVVVLTAVGLIVRYQTRHRMQRRLAQLERQHAIERERARIAQDIHDDIGASLTRITMLSQSVQSELKQPQQAAAVLDRICSTAREVTRALDEIVWAVDPRHDTLDSLVCYMGKFAQDFLAAADVRCRLDLPVDLPAWPLTAETRHNLFLAFKEALNNALKHAGATEVRVSLAFRPHAFVLAVKDNGRGFDLMQYASSEGGRGTQGNGLINLKRRLAQIGGRCEIVTRANEGTCVSFIVEVADPDSAVPPEPSAAQNSLPSSSTNNAETPPLSVR